MQSIETILFWEAEKKITNNLYFYKYKDVKAKDGVIYKRGRNTGSMWSHRQPTTIMHREYARKILHKSGISVVVG